MAAAAARYDALLLQHGAAGVAEAVRRATRARREHDAAHALAAMIRLDAPHDQAAARRAAGGAAVVEALATFSRSLAVARAALAALSRVWPDAAADARDTSLVPPVLDALARHRADVHVQQAGLRLLRLHVRSEDDAVALAHAPGVVAAVDRAMRAFDADPTVQHWGCARRRRRQSPPAPLPSPLASPPAHPSPLLRSAEIVCALNGFAPEAIAAAHGALGWAMLAEASVRLCLSTPRPSTLRVGGVDWQAKVLALFPRLRSRA